ncbi:MAG: MFS transporter [Rhodoblastus sp.]|nr:MFS transporter [Rhodoblastus sp.]MCB1523262.1 MFS transporter [Rhodoblastus sp.]MCO5088552.1 MFS transporter [Methylobacteriaceae bacterium]
MQTLATTAAFSVPAVAPAIARDLHLPGALIGFFPALVYGVGIISSLYSPSFILRFGAVRVIQAVMAAVCVMLGVCALGTAGSIAAGAALLGLAYGSTAPASAHLLVPRTPQRVYNLVMSIRQAGLPLAGILAGVMMPPMTLAFGWRVALAAQIPTSFALLVALEFVRRKWDVGLRPGYPLFVGALAQPLRLLRQNADIKRLTIMSFVFTGAQLCFISFMTVHLTQSAGFDLVTAGWTLAAYQGAALVSRPLLGWVADKYVSPMRLLAALGFLMCASAAVSALFTAAWPGLAIVVVCLAAGFSASGFTGLAYAEFARLGGAARTEATGLGSAAMFAGVLVLPPLFGLTATATHAFVLPYAALAAATFAASVMVWRGARR